MDFSFVIKSGSLHKVYNNFKPNTNSHNKFYFIVEYCIKYVAVFRMNLVFRIVYTSVKYM